MTELIFEEIYNKHKNNICYSQSNNLALIILNN
jgi:hypothetical protein